MAIDVLTNNAYLKAAITSLNPRNNSHPSLLFIDLDSYACLDDILHEMTSRDGRRNYGVCFVGANGILFEVFRRLAPLSVEVPVLTLRQAFSENVFPSLKKAINVVRDIKSLTMMTERQRLCLRALKTHDDIKDIAIHLKFSEKAVYSLITHAGTRLNLTSLTHIKFFVSKNDI